MNSVNSNQMQIEYIRSQRHIFGRLINSFLLRHFHTSPLPSLFSIAVSPSTSIDSIRLREPQKGLPMLGEWTWLHWFFNEPTKFLRRLWMLLNILYFWHDFTARKWSQWASLGLLSLRGCRLIFAPRCVSRLFLQSYGIFSSFLIIFLLNSVITGIINRTAVRPFLSPSTPKCRTDEEPLLTRWSDSLTFPCSLGLSDAGQRTPCTTKHHFLYWFTPRISYLLISLPVSKFHHLYLSFRSFSAPSFSVLFLNDLLRLTGG